MRKIVRTIGALVARDFRKHSRKIGAVAAVFIFGWIIQNPGALDLFWWLR